MPPPTTIDDEVLCRLAHLIPTPVIVARPSGALVDANAAACALFGYTAEEMRARGRAELCDLEDPRLVAGTAVRSATGTSVGELRLVKKSGAQFEAELTSTFIPQPEGEGRLWLSMRDLTSVRSTEAALRVREDELIALSDATLEALFVHQDGTILATNKAARELYRLPPDGAVGRRLLDFIAPEGVDEVQRRIAARSSEPYESVGLRADGTKFPAAVQARTASFRGRPARLAAIRDLTEVHRMHASLAFADRMASVGTLAAGVAHEINNPLSFVTLGLDHAVGLLEAAGSTPDDVRAAVDTLRDAQIGAQRVQTIVGDLKAFSSPVDETAGPVELRRVIEYAARMAAVEIKHRARLTLDVGDLPMVAGNETRLGQVFLNLLVNAAHAIPQGAADRHEISVRAHAEGAHVVVAVSDTGDGIAREVIGRIFEPFVSTKSHGTGLGLAICHGIVSRLGGSIDVTSKPGRGTTFRVRLPSARAAPASQPAAAPLRAAASQPAAGPLARRRVLLVDDEVTLRAVIGRLLESDYDVTELGSARDALALLEQGATFDAVLCDLLMPAMTGMEFFTRVVERFPALVDRMIFLTGGVFTHEAITFFEKTTRPRLQKPFSADALFAALRAVTELTPWAPTSS